MKKKQLATVILILLCFASALEADDYRKANDFFGKNDGIGYGQKRSNPYGLGDKTQIKPNKEEKTQPEHNDFFGTRDNKSGSSDFFENKEDNKKSKKPQVEGIKVLSLGIIVNALDSKHLERHLETLIKDSTKLDLDLNTVNLVGFNHAIKKFEMPIVARFGRVQYHTSVPSEYNITASPTWILQTEEGQILLEGIDDPSQYMNSRAEFIDGASSSPYKNKGNNSGFFGGKKDNNKGMAFF